MRPDGVRAGNSTLANGVSACQSCTGTTATRRAANEASGVLATGDASCARRQMSVTLLVVVVFVVDTLRTEPQTFVAMVGILLLATVLDLVWARLRARREAAR